MPTTSKTRQNGRIWPKMGLGREFPAQSGKRPTRPQRAHFIGIGGIGVSALARYYKSSGWQVSGSDESPSPLIKELKSEGIRINVGQRKKNLAPRPDLVIYTQAAPPTNPELKEAKRLKIKSLTYPQALGELTRKFKTIALAGTHGKSTTTAMMALVAIEAGWDPTVIIGTKLKEFGGKNFRPGKSEYLIIEADEYKNAFLRYHPSAVLITNIDREHLDYFKDLNDIKKSFLKFIRKLPETGLLALNRDNSPLLSLEKKIRREADINWCNIITYSLKERHWINKIKNVLKVPGAHNISNALGIFKLAYSMGIEEEIILRALSKYQGSWRRMELRGRLAIRDLPFAVPVYDDYAHHPTEIKATISAFREKFPKSKIVCVFQPHQAERLKRLFKEFTSAFDEADTLILLDIFKVRGREAQSAERRAREMDSRKLAEAIQRKRSSLKVTYLSDSKKLRNLINRNLSEFAISDLRLAAKGAVVIMMGAGNIVDLTDRLVS